MYADLWGTMKHNSRFLHALPAWPAGGQSSCAKCILWSLVQQLILWDRLGKTQQTNNSFHTF